MGATRRRILPMLLVPVFLLLAPVLVAAADPEASVDPGGTCAATVRVRNDRGHPVRTWAAVRLRGSPFWCSRGEQGVCGRWVRLPKTTVSHGGEFEFSVQLPVPLNAPPVMSIEIGKRGGGMWTVDKGWRLVALESSRTLRGSRGSVPIPFRVVVGDARALVEHSSDGVVVTEAVRDEVEWDALRERFGIVSPDSWGIHPGESDPSPMYLDSWFHASMRFASEVAPDLGNETLLAIATPEHPSGTTQVRLCVRSVDRLPDGTVLCRYAFKSRRARHGTFPADMHDGRFLVVAIPRTESPVVFEQVR